MYKRLCVKFQQIRLSKWKQFSLKFENVISGCIIFLVKLNSFSWSRINTTAKNGCVLSPTRDH